MRGSSKDSLDPLGVSSDSSELRVLNVEKEIVSYALTSLYESEADGKISKSERDKLLGKYMAEMQRLDEKIYNKQKHELHELETGKNGISTGINMLKSEDVAREPNLENSPHMEKEAGEPPAIDHEDIPTPFKNKKNLTTSEDEIKAIQEEILQTIKRLESLEIEE